MPVISGLTYAATDSTIVATWTTDTSSDSNLSAGGKAAIDNGVAANSTSHQCVVTGLLKNTAYSCVVTSGGSSSSPQNVTTQSAHSVGAVRSVSYGSPSATAKSGDINTNVVSNDNKTYMNRDDTLNETPTSNQCISTLNESTNVMTLLNALSAYGTETQNLAGMGGTINDKQSGLFSMAGNLFMFQGRTSSDGGSGGVQDQKYGNVMMSTDKGVTWNNFQNTAVFNANGVHPAASPLPFTDINIGWLTPIRYAADDGTLGYNTSGQQIDGANAFVYVVYSNFFFTNGGSLYLMRIPRIQLLAQNHAAFQFWSGPSGPNSADFVNDTFWAATDAAATPIYAAANATASDLIYIPALNCYMMYQWHLSTAGNFHAGAVWTLLSAPTPAGPWTIVDTHTWSGEANTFYYPCVLHRSAINSSGTSNIPLTIFTEGGFGGSQSYYFAYTVPITISGVSSGASSIPSLRQHAQNVVAAAQSPVITIGAPVLKGNLLTALGNFFGASATCTSMTIADNLGDSVAWTPIWGSIQSPAGGTIHKFIQGWYKIAGTNAQASPTVTLTSNAASQGSTQFVFAEWSWPSATATVDQIANAAAAQSQAIVGLSFVNTLVNDIIFCLSVQNTSTFTGFASFTPPFFDIDNPASYNALSAGTAVAAAGTYTYAGTWTGTVNGNTNISAGFSISAGATPSGGGAYGPTITQISGTPLGAYGTTITSY